MAFRILLFCFFVSNFCWAQTTPEATVGDLDLRIMKPQLDRNLPYTIQSKLERKIIDIFTQNSVANRKGSTFVVYPMLNVIEYGKLEGITTDQTVQLELSLLVENVFSAEDFMVFTRNISGAGKTKQAAVNKAISGIRPQRKVYADFITEMQDKIARFYEEECENITADARIAIKENEFQKAVAMLQVIPENSDCKKANQTLLNQAYVAFQKENCQSLTQQAEVAILKKDYKDAIDLLGQIDPKAPCKEASKQLLQTITQKVDEQTAKKMEFLNKVYDDNVEIEKARQKSMKSISNTYIEGIEKH